jgi:hypothetical protein
MYKPATRWQYFISREGIHTEFPSQNFHHLSYSQCRELQDSRHRSDLSIDSVTIAEQFQFGSTSISS